MRSLVLVLAAPIFCGQAFGWGCDGHQMVALIARAHLTPAASAAVDKLFAEGPLQPAHRRFCQDQPADLMADAAPWADDVKASDKTFLWHQIDLPMQLGRLDNGGDFSRWCPPIGPSVGGKDRPGCIFNAIQFERDLMVNPKESAAERAKALRMFIHLAGDLTQPLHMSDNSDEGGNCTSFTLPFLEKPTTLHGIWDFDLITHELQEKKITEMDLAKTIDGEFAAEGRGWETEKIDVIAWGWEAHALALPNIYSPLKPRIPVAPVGDGHTSKAACDAGRAKVAALHIEITPEYRANALRLIHRQIAKAGYRLADVLNTTFK